MLEKRPEKPRPTTKFGSFMHDHGRAIADGSSWGRLVLGGVAGAAVLMDKHKIAHTAHTVGTGTDWVDGRAAGMDKNGPTEAGGKLDNLVDKAFVIATEAPMAYKRKIPRVHFAARTARDLIMAKAVRPHLEKQGIDTKAVLSGKTATAAVLIVDNLSLTSFGEKHPKIMKNAHRVATGLKIYSLFDAPRVWKKRHAEKLQRKEAVA